MRIEAAIRELTGDLRSEGELDRQQTGESNAGSELTTESLEVSFLAGLGDELAAVERAEERIRRGTYGLSVESGLPIPEERLEVEPLAERTVEEQRRYDELARRSG